eukprot:TRINITY_DN23156_c0_g1_i1.p1 TRINITY_DN23156_c0_g1~~TRINITY_DN23156_c0_g1_i1.p1  ORF type:complete len:412 (-),score=57.69 TRINITY_DN23156_c0_g1_i1:47-1282(-)
MRLRSVFPHFTLSRRLVSTQAAMSEVVHTTTGGAQKKHNPLRFFLKSDARSAVLDGGMTTSLPHGVEKHCLWGHQLLFGADGGLDVLKRVHRAWLENGADVLGTLTYKLSEELIEQGRDRGLLKDLESDADPVPVQILFDRALQTAVQARDEYVRDNESVFQKDGGRPKPVVFASIGPCVDSTEFFRGATDPKTRSDGTEEETIMVSYYRKKVSTILRAGLVDGLAVETLAGSREALLAAQVMRENGVHGASWISFCCRNGEETTTGEKLRDCVREIAVKYADVVGAIGVNCIDPCHAEGCIRTIRLGLDDAKAIVTAGDAGSSLTGEIDADAVDDIMVAVYPNSGECWDSSPGKRSWSGKEKMTYLTGADAIRFRNAGAQLVGGCCRVMPKQIGLFREALVANSSGNVQT